MKVPKMIVWVLLIGVLITGLSCLIFSGTGKTYAAFYNTHTEKIRDIQLMLALKGVRVGPSKEAIQINGKLDSLTEEGIKTYQNQNNLPETGDISDALYYKLYRDIQIHSDIIATDNKKASHNQTNDNQVIEAVLLELNKTKEDLKNTNVALKSLTDNMAEHFLGNFRDVTSLVGTGLGILAGVLGGFIVLGYGRLEEKITEKIEKESITAHENMVNDTKFRIYINLSNAFYVYYRELLAMPDHPAFKSGTELATHFADIGIKSAEAITPKTPKSTFMQKLAKLHKLYHLASANIINPDPVDSKKEIIQQAFEHMSFVNDLLESKDELEKGYGLTAKESIAWILETSGDQEEQARGKEILNKILQDENTTPALRKEFKDNYDKMRKGKERMLAQRSQQAPSEHRA